jgi:hypothetical protein
MPATATVRSRGDLFSPEVATPVAAAVPTPAVIVTTAVSAAQEVTSDGAVVPVAQTSAAPLPDSAPRTEEDAPVLEVREVEIPRHTRKRAQIKLTLLDGTTIKVPSGRKRRADSAAPDSSAAPSEPELTAADLVAALRAAAHGADAAEVFGTNLRWEKMMAAILTLLLKKHLIFERELIEELKKI